MAGLERIYNYRRVDDRLATSGQPTEEQLGLIAEAGYTTVINLALHDDPRYSLEDEAGSVAQLDMDYVYIPVQWGGPTREKLEAFFDAMDQHGGERVWIHCAANMRVSAFLGLYRVIRQGWDRDAAFELMRSLFEPNEVWSAFIEDAIAHKSD